nr:huntingtin-interacting protein 1-like [Lytechinus pictus]
MPKEAKTTGYCFGNKAQKQLRQHTDHLKDLGTMWNPSMPGGNLVLQEPEKDEKCGKFNYFQMSVEIFDYLESLITLQAAVFRSFDMSRALSGTSSGQCRLSPLIPVILDSAQLYDFSVRLLYKLHACLPSDTLEGHRSRFLKQFHALKEFYTKCSSIIYFRRLIQVPITCRPSKLL